MLFSPKVLDIIEPVVGDDAKDFQRMIYTQSLAYTSYTFPNIRELPVLGLQQIGGITDCRSLTKNSPQWLAECSKDDLQALFLLVIGTILAVGYTKPVTEFPLFPQNQVRKPFNKWLQILG